MTRVPGLPVTVTYADPALTFRAEWPFSYQYPQVPDSKFVLQDHPVPGSMRVLAAPLTLPDVVTCTFYLKEVPLHDPVRPTWFNCDLDPALNHGYTRAGFSPHHDEDHGFNIKASTSPDDHQPAHLHRCPRCGDPWCRQTTEQYGYATRCPSCGHGSFCDIGD